MLILKDDMIHWVKQFCQPKPATQAYAVILVPSFLLVYVVAISSPKDPGNQILRPACHDVKWSEKLTHNTILSRSSSLEELFPLDFFSFKIFRIRVKNTLFKHTTKTSQVENIIYAARKVVRVKEETFKTGSYKRALISKS